MSAAVNGNVFFCSFVILYDFSGHKPDLEGKTQKCAEQRQGLSCTPYIVISLSVSLSLQCRVRFVISLCVGCTAVYVCQISGCQIHCKCTLLYCTVRSRAVHTNRIRCQTPSGHPTDDNDMPLSSSRSMLALVVFIPVSTNLSEGVFLYTLKITSAPNINF